MSTVVPARITADGLVVEGGINGWAVRLIVDTGVNGFLLRPQTAERAGLPFDRAEIRAGRQARVRPAAVRFGQALLRLTEEDNAVVADLPEGLPDGILGVPLFRHFVVTFDYDRARLVLTPPETFRASRGAAMLPIRIVHTTPQVRLRVEGAGEGWFKLDTGAGNALTLFSPFVESHHLRERYPHRVRVATGRSLGGILYGDMVRLRSFALGPFVLRGVVTELSRDTSGGYFSGKDAAGNLGAEILRRFVVTFDYSRNRLYLAPGQSRNAPFFGPRTGYALDQDGGVFRIIDVAAGSPAEEAGLKRGDRVLALDGVPIDKTTADSRRAAVRRPPGSLLTLRVQTGSEAPRDVPILLRDLI